MLFSCTDSTDSLVVVDFEVSGGFVGGNSVVGESDYRTLGIAIDACMCLSCNYYGRIGDNFGGGNMFST